MRAGKSGIGMITGLKICYKSFSLVHYTSFKLALLTKMPIQYTAETKVKQWYYYMIQKQLHTLIFFRYAEQEFSTLIDLVSNRFTGCQDFIRPFPPVFLDKHI